MRRLRDGIKRSTTNLKDKVLDVRDTITQNISISPALARTASSKKTDVDIESGPMRRRSSGADVEEDKRNKSEEKLNELESDYMEEVLAYDDFVEAN